MSILQVAIEIVSQNINNQHRRNLEFNFDPGNRSELLTRIENITLQILQCVAEDGVPQYNVRYGIDKGTIISYGREPSRAKFAVVTYLLSKIYRLLALNKRITKR